MGDRFRDVYSQVRHRWSVEELYSRARLPGEAGDRQHHLDGTDCRPADPGGPEPLLRLWDEMMEAIARLAAQPFPFRRPEKVVADVQISAVSAPEDGCSSG